MNPTTVTILVSTITTVVGGSVGYFVKYVLDKKKEYGSENVKLKREMYQKYLDKMLSFFENDYSDPQHATRLSAEFQEYTKTFNRSSILYASSKVLRAVGTQNQYFWNNFGKPVNTTIATRNMTRVLKYMRKDIGLGNWWLGIDGQAIIRVMLKDYQQIVYPMSYKTTVWFRTLAHKKKTT